MKRKARFLCHLPHSRCSCIHPSVFLVSYIKFHSFGFPLRIPSSYSILFVGSCRTQISLTLFLAAILKKFTYLSILDGQILITWSAVCEGLLKTRRHIESREDPGYEVAELQIVATSFPGSTPLSRWRGGEGPGTHRHPRWLVWRYRHSFAFITANIIASLDFTSAVHIWFIPYTISSLIRSSRDH